ncbi:MAG: ParB/RepB/Spo0J family partition protein [Gammaproteobacteria bacterium]|nr:ParB/RepB/Spo0J family partition protein [Gammaproteobacteria bacterium]
MTAKKKRLGRGLDALLSDPGAASAGDRDGKLIKLPVESLQRGQYQPRTRMDKEALEELAQSIKARGIVQPIVARELDSGGYEIIAGERRWRAAQLAGLADVPVVLRSIPDEAALAISLIENIQRENLNPIEEASGLRRLLEEFGLTHDKVAQGVGRSRSAVSNILRLLSLNQTARDLLEDGKLEMGHARALLSLGGEEQDTAARTVVSRRLSVRQTEELVKQLQNKSRANRKKKRNSRVDPDVQRLQDELSDRLGTHVSIKHNKGRGQLVIDYHSLEELDGLLSRIR